jgi:Flp pilus assembly secretin CpaC
MTVSSTLSGLKRLVRHAVMFAVLAATLSALPAMAGESRSDDTLDVVVDRSRLVKMPERVATVVIGNPLIADASLQAGGLMVITGKGYGTTNLIALDRKGNALMEKVVQVLGPDRDVVVVYKGAIRRLPLAISSNSSPRTSLRPRPVPARRPPSAIRGNRAQPDGFQIVNATAPLARGRRNHSTIHIC